MIKTLSKSYEDATCRYYGSDKDPLKLIPVVRDQEVAHEIAIQVDQRLEAITEEAIVKSALRIQSQNRYNQEKIFLDGLKEHLLQDRLNMIVVNAELTHARLAPSDFHEDAMQSGAYEMGNGLILAAQLNPDDLRQ